MCEPSLVLLQGHALRNALASDTRTAKFSRREHALLGAAGPAREGPLPPGVVQAADLREEGAAAVREADAWSHNPFFLFVSHLPPITLKAGENVYYSLFF